MSVLSNLQELKTIVVSNLTQANKDLSDVKAALARLETKADTAKEMLDKHDKSIENLKVWRYINVGSWLTAIGGLFK